MPGPKEPSNIAARFPGPATLYPSRVKWLGMLAGCTVFSLGGVMMIREGADGGWFVLIFFGLCVLVAVGVLLPGAGRLRLDRDGFEVTHFYRHTRTRWQDASRFATTALPPASYVMVVYDDASQKQSVLTSLNVGLTGHNAALPDTYGLTAGDLAAGMASWRERALDRP